jgi:hypothetical protein
VPANGCGAGKSCIHDDVRPWLRDPRPSASGGYRALAPCHDDTTHSLSVSIGGTGRVIWHCFAGCDSERTRNALIKAGVSPRCLVRPAGDAADFEAIVSQLVFGKDSHAHKVLRLAAYLRGFGLDLPGGADLRALADDCGVSVAEAYKARGLNR